MSSERDLFTQIQVPHPNCIPCLILEPGRHPKSCLCTVADAEGSLKFHQFHLPHPIGLSRWSVLLGYWTSPLGMWGSWRFRAMRTKAAKHDRLTWTVSTWSATWNSAYICVHKFPWIVILRMSWRSGPRRLPQCLASIFQSKMSYSCMFAGYVVSELVDCVASMDALALYCGLCFGPPASKITRRLPSALATSSIWLFLLSGYNCSSEARLQLPALQHESILFD